jgi:hypothetical protein
LEVNNASEVEMYFEAEIYFERNRQVPILRLAQFPQGTGTEVDDEMIIGNPGTSSQSRSPARRNVRGLRALLSSFPKQQGNMMPKDMHQKAAEHHEQAAKTHRAAAEQHGSNDHSSAKQQSAQAFDKSKAAHEHSAKANDKSQQQK